MKDYWLIPWADSPPYGNGYILLKASTEQYKVLSHAKPLVGVPVRGRYITMFFVFSQEMRWMSDYL